jgi:hypothetical protein
LARAARVRAALRAAVERLAAERLRATSCAWRESARCEAERVGCFFSAFSAARARVVELPLVLRDARAFDEELLRVDRVDEPLFDDAPLRVLERLPLRVLALRETALLRVPRVPLPALLREPALLRVPRLPLAAPLRLAALLRLALRFAPLRAALALEPFSGIGTPARRASDSAIAIACLAFFAPCLPSRM